MNILFLLQFSAQSLIRNKARSLLTLVGVSLGISLFVAIEMINSSTRDSFGSNLEAISGKAELSISSNDNGFTTHVLDIVKSQPEIEAAVPLMESRAFLVGANSTEESITLLGVDLLQEQSVRVYKTSPEKDSDDLLEDPLLFLNQPDSLILTKKFADEKNLKKNDEIWLATSSGKKKFVIRGLLLDEGPARAYGGRLGILDIDAARFHFGKRDKVDRIDLVPNAEWMKNHTIDDLKILLKNALNTYPNLKIESPESLATEKKNMIAAYQRMLTFFSSLALLVGLFMIFNSVQMSVAEKRKQIATLRAIGSSKPSIFLLFSLDAFWLGGMGTALGILLGYFLSGALVEKVSLSVMAQYHTRIDIHTLHLSPSLIVITFLLGLISSFLASLYPSWKATQVAPVEALRDRNLLLVFNQETNSSAKNKIGTVFLLGCGFFLLSCFCIKFQLFKIWFGFEQISQGLSVLGAVFLGPWFVFLAIKTLNRLFKNRSLNLQITTENILNFKSQTQANIMALMVGLFFVTLTSSVQSSFKNSILGWLGKVLNADLILTSSGRMITAEVQPVEADIQKFLLTFEGVTQPGEGRGTASRIVYFEQDKKMYAIKAFDRPILRTRYQHFSFQEGFDQNGKISHDPITIGESFFEQSNPVLVVSKNYLMHHPSLKLGDPLILNTPTGAVTFKIFAFSIDYASSAGVFYMNRMTFQKYWLDSLATGFSLHFDPKFIKNVEDGRILRNKMADQVEKKYGLRVFSNDEMKQNMNQILDQTFAYTKTIEFAALIVGLLGLLNTFSIGLMERSQDLGTLRALGTSRRRLFRILLLESVLQGSFGALAAVLYGSIISRLWVQYSLADLFGWVIEFYLPISVALTVIGLGTLVSIIAGAIPSYRFSRKPIVEFLKARS